MAHLARKRFGQHFLVDESIIHQLVQAIAPKSDESMVEIGPGQMALTYPLLQKLNHLSVIEIDRDLVQRLQGLVALQSKLSVIQADVLTVDFSSLIKQGDRKLRVVGNLPYNISTPILFHLEQYADHIQDQHFMLQKEVIDRMVAEPGSKDYGRLSVMLQARYKMQSLFDVPPESFDPPPKVMSSVVRMIPLTKNRPQAKDGAMFARIVAQAFSQRRKMLRRVLADWAFDFDALDIDETARPETLSVTDFIRLADAAVAQEQDLI